MGKDLKGKELGKGITQGSTGLYSADSQKYGISLQCKGVAYRRTKE